MGFSECAYEIQWLVLCDFEVLEHVHESYHMRNTQIVIVRAEKSVGIRNIEPSGIYRVHEASDCRLIYGQIVGSFAGLPLVEPHCHWRGNCAGLLHSEVRPHHENVAVLRDVDLVSHPIALNLYAKIEGDTPKMMYPEHLLHLILVLPYQALVRNDWEIIDIQNDHSDDYALNIIMKHKQSSVNM
jgi:hypothetical protein